MAKGDSRDEMEAGVSPRQPQFRDDTEHVNAAHCYAVVWDPKFLCHVTRIASDSSL